jgi:hypothetical protein
MWKKDAMSFEATTRALARKTKENYKKSPSQYGNLLN